MSAALLIQLIPALVALLQQTPALANDIAGLVGRVQGSGNALPPDEAAAIYQALADAHKALQGAQPA